MALKAGKNVSLTLGDNTAAGSVVRDLSAYVTRLTMSLKGKTLIDVTAMADSGHTWASDELEDGSFTVDFLYDPEANTVWATLCSTLTGLRTQTAAQAFVIGPQGSTSGYPRITGTCWLEDAPLEAAVGDMIKMSGVPFKIDGAVTVDVYPDG